MRPRLAALALVLVLLVLLLLARRDLVLGPTPAAAPPDGPLPFTTRRAFPNAGFKFPVLVTSARDGTGRLFVVEKGGRILVLPGRPDATPSPFLDLSDRVAARGGNDERGLLGLAFDPGYAANRRFYVDYTAAPEGSPTRISRFTARADDPGRADPAGEEVLLEIPQPWANHNGGMVAFGPDQLLYVGMGDGGSGNDPNNVGQDPGKLLGKLLRIDPSRAEGARPYAIPPDNPFVATPGAAPEVFALGLRNPWRFSFDRLDGALWAGDVGQNRFEEVDRIDKGANLGWRRMEGFACHLDPPCTEGAFAAPLADYDRSVGASVTGGYVYRGTRHPALVGRYLFADFMSGRIFALGPDPGGPGRGPAGFRVAAGYAVEELARSEQHIASFGEDESGELYLVDYPRGLLLELEARAPAGAAASRPSPGP